MGRNVKIQEVDQFEKAIRVPEAAVSKAILEGVGKLDERTELEPALQEIMFDPNETPHGPTEIADVITSKLIVRGEKVLGAFILKGRSFPQVRSRDIGSQLLKVRQLPDLGFLSIVAVGNVQDDAHRDFVQTALDADCDYLLIDAVECARLLLAYEKVCPQDGTRYRAEGVCEFGHRLDPGVKLEMEVREDLKYEVPSLSDVSHGGAKRYSAVILVDRHYSREQLREIVGQATARVRQAEYHRTEIVAERWRGHPADVVWLYLARDLQDVRNTNWICRTEFIDSKLDPAMRPMPLKADEEVDEVRICWNSMYEEMKEFYSEHAATKGELLDILDPLVQELIEIGSQIEEWWDSWQRGELKERALVDRVQTMRERVGELYNSSGDFPFPPEELKDLDLIASSMVGHMDNVVLYFSKEGLAQWSADQRNAIARMSLEDFRKDVGRWQYEREKVR